MKLRAETHTEELVLAVIRDQDPPRRAANTAWLYYEARECADRCRLAGALLRKAGRFDAVSYLPARENRTRPTVTPLAVRRRAPAAVQDDRPVGPATPEAG